MSTQLCWMSNTHAMTCFDSNDKLDENISAMTCFDSNDKLGKKISKC